MSEHPFITAGPICSEGSVYIERNADAKAMEWLSRMEYVTVVEPRQSGKTSLINRLILRMSPHGYCFAVRDLSVGRSQAASVKDWYAWFGSWLAQALDFVSDCQALEIPSSCAGCETFFAKVARIAQALNRRVVIVLDEAGAIPTELATDFFSLIRSIYTTRQSYTWWKYVTFVIAGAFNPKELIKDTSVSNFNVDQRVTLTDFNGDQVRQLVTHLGLPCDETDAVAKRIYYWTDGQPYLCQYLCHSIAEQALCGGQSNMEAAVDEAVDGFFACDMRHLSRIEEVTSTGGLLDYTLRITRRASIRFSPAVNYKHFLLAHVLGVIKPDSGGRCRIRNRIYERAFSEAEWTGAAEGEGAHEVIKSQRITVFISYCHADQKYVSEDRRSLLSFLRGLEGEGISFWLDRRLKAGDLWDNEISDRLATANIALVLVSQAFLNSAYCTNVEAQSFIESRKLRGLRILPVILSACDWREREWLSGTQVLPLEGANIEQHYSKQGERKALYLQILNQIRENAKKILERS
jgi:hypothetical protein